MENLGAEKCEIPCEMRSYVCMREPATDRQTLSRNVIMDSRNSSLSTLASGLIGDAQVEGRPAHSVQGVVKLGPTACDERKPARRLLLCLLFGERFHH